MWYVTTSRCCTASTTKSPPEASMTLFKCPNTCFFGTYMETRSLFYLICFCGSAHSYTLHICKIININIKESVTGHFEWRVLIAFLRLTKRSFLKGVLDSTFSSLLMLLHITTKRMCTIKGFLCPVISKP
nr:hypothetical protein [Tanacetum cinerariifolium]